jgi:hypothetical protein
VINAFAAASKEASVTFFYLGLSIHFFSSLSDLQPHLVNSSGRIPVTWLAVVLISCRLSPLARGEGRSILFIFETNKKGTFQLHFESFTCQSGGNNATLFAIKPFTRQRIPRVVLTGRRPPLSNSFYIFARFIMIFCLLEVAVLFSVFPGF